MPPALSRAELAGQAECPPERIDELVAKGILVPSGEGAFRPADVPVVRLMEMLSRAGISADDVAHGVETGELSFEEFGSFFREPPSSSRTLVEAAAELGSSPDLLRRLVTELGLPPPEERLRDDEAEIVAALTRVFDLGSDEDAARFARQYGHSLLRLAQAGVSLYHTAVYRRVQALGLPSEETARRVDQKAGEMLALVDRLVPWLHRRHLEHFIYEYVTGNIERFLDESGIATRGPARPQAIAFLDLTGFTALTEEQGDEAAAELAATLSGVVQSAATSHGGRPVKWLGDGVMFHFPDPGAAVLAGLELLDAVPGAGLPPARVGVNAGPVLFQDGDYFGRTVNVAARIADYARPREVLVSAGVAELGTPPGVAFAPVGDIALKGVSQPVPLLAAVRTPRPG